MSLVSTEWLFENKDKVKIIDSSWHLPSENRNSLKEYSSEHIPNAIYFDIDKNSDQNSNLPHMLPNKDMWEKIMSSNGISNNDKIVVYDNSKVLSSCRLWYMLLYFGHSKKLVSVLNGGLERWKKNNFPITEDHTKLKMTNYKAYENKFMVKNLDEIDKNIENKVFSLVDARSKDRFEGKTKEPREGVRSGSIKNSICIPFNNVIKDDKTFKDKEELKVIFNNIISDIDNNNVVFSCGSGITSCVLALAYSLINNNYNPTIYDGSWAEYGKIFK